jgi:Domain of unknown function (DU1801)
MEKLKTQKTRASVSAFLNGIADDVRRKDCQTLVRIMKRAVGAAPKMWGSSIVGFGHYHYKYASGRENDWFLAGFSPRKQDLTIYLMSGIDRHDALVSKLGKFKTAKSCLYIKRLADIDMAVLEELIAESVKHMKANG